VAASDEDEPLPDPFEPGVNEQQVYPVSHGRPDISSPHPSKLLSATQVPPPAVHARSDEVLAEHAAAERRPIATKRMAPIRMALGYTPPWRGRHADLSPMSRRGRKTGTSPAPDLATTASMGQSNASERFFDVRTSA
jgi:hypothetical protein